MNSNLKVLNESDKILKKTLKSRVIGSKIGCIKQKGIFTRYFPVLSEFLLVKILINIKGDGYESKCYRGERLRWNRTFASA